MKNLVITGLAVAALFGLPAESSAKERGCGYRLAGLEDARIQLARALRHGGNVDLARAQLRRAEIKAFEEGCIGVRREAGVVKRWHAGDHRFGDHRFDHHRFDHHRFDHHRFDHHRFDHHRFDRRHDRHRFIRSQRFARKLDDRLDRARRIARARYLFLVELSRKRRLSYAEDCERDDLRRRWKF